MTGPFIKICGLNERASVEAAASAGATHIGFVFFPRSPRHLSHERARALASHAPAHLARVALLVDAADGEIDAAAAAIGAGMLQLHGRETPARVAEIGARTGLPVIKALPVSSAADIEAAHAYTAADRILFDAKPPASSDRPGGHGLTFDWSLLAGLALSQPWLLSGGLNPGNVAEAIRRTGAPGVDVSSGVEAAPGIKSIPKIQAFCAAALSVYGSSNLEPAS